MKHLSLRWRLSLVTMAVLTAACMGITLWNVTSAGQQFESVQTQVTAVRADVASLESDITVQLQDRLMSYYLYPSEEEIISFQLAGEAAGAGEYYQEDGAAVALEIYSLIPGEVAAVTSDSVLYVNTNLSQAASTIQVAQRTFNYSSLIFMAAMILLGGVLVFLASGYALRPVRAFSQEVSGISEHQLSTRVHTPDSGDEIAMLSGAFNDMLERLERAFSAQKQFSTAAAHELKTPLAAIRTNIDVLALDDSPGPEEYGHTLRVVKAQAERMSRLVDDLFAMSSLEEYRLDEWVALDPLLAGVVEDVKPALEAKGLSLSVSGQGLCVRGNGVMLSRALGNIVENAVRYTAAHDRVAITCAAEGDYAAITVADSGPGIPPEHLPHIFEAFYRADPSRSRKLGGAGLGLAIADEIVTRHGGGIAAQSSPGNDTTFTVRLPLPPDSPL